MKLPEQYLVYSTHSTNVSYCYCWGFPSASVVKKLPTVWETWVRSLGWEDPLEKGMATTPVFLPEKFQGQRRLEGYSPWGHKESDMTESYC